LLFGLFSSNHSITLLIAHTAPAENIPSKNMEIYLLSPMNSCQGANNVKDMKKPTQVDVQRTHCINPEINLNIGLKRTQPTLGCALL
jgi:hypothetical protein